MLIYTMTEIYFNRKDFPEFKFLSNFYQHEIMIPSFGFWPTSEHFYQAMKTNIVAEQEEIRTAKHPAEAKELGAKVTLLPDWHNIKEDVMRVALRYKFCYFSDPWLVEMLLMTTGYDLYEYAPWDNYWGTGNDYEGSNRLGVLLMELRDELT